MRTLIVAFCTLISLSLSAQAFIVRGQDTIASTSNQGTYLIDLFNDLSPENLHYLTKRYGDNKFSFKYEEDLRSTMSSYLNDGLVVVNWRLTKNEKSLLKKYKKRELEDWEKNESLTTTREVDNAKTTIGLDNNNSTTAGNGQQYKPKALEDLRLSVNASVMPSEIVNSLGGSVYLNYKKLLIGYTEVSGGTGRQEFRSGNLYTISQSYIGLNLGSIGYEVSEDLFLKGGYGVFNISTELRVIDNANNDYTTYDNINEFIEIPSFGVLYMNRTYHFNFGVDLVGASDPLMLFSLGFNL